MRAPETRNEPMQNRSVETVRALREAAVKVIEREGREFFTTGQIATEAGVSIGTMYRYYNDKIAVLDDVYPDRVRGVERPWLVVKNGKVQAWSDGLEIVSLDAALDEFASIDVIEGAYRLLARIDGAWKDQYLSALRTRLEDIYLQYNTPEDRQVWNERRDDA